MDAGENRGRLVRYLLVAAFVVRLIWGQMQPTDDAAVRRLPDQGEYLELARNLLHGSGLMMRDPHFGDDIYAYRTPGYPLFLAACGGSVRAARAVQAAVDTSTALAIYLLARRWLSDWYALLAAAVVAVNPFLIYFSGLILSETLFTAMVAWGMVLYASLSCRTQGKPAKSEIRNPNDESMTNGPMTNAPLIGALLLALAVLVRPGAAGLPVVLAIGAAMMNRGRARSYPKGWPLPPATTALLLVLLVLAPWGYRNSRVLGRWIWTTTNSGITSYDGLNDYATGASDQRFAFDLPELRGVDEVRRNDYFSSHARAWAQNHPGRLAELAARKVARTWSPLPLSEAFGRPTYRWIAAVYAVPFDTLVLLGLCGSWSGKTDRRRGLRSAKVFLLLPAIYLTAIHAMSVGSLRYRLPAEPPMAVLAAAGVGWLTAKAPRAQRD